jgi:hypothetical protein
MNWRYYFPHVWEEPRTCWEDVWLRPDDPNFTGLAYYITVESFAYLTANAEEDADFAELERLRAETGTLLWVRSYDGSAKRLEVRVRAEDFSWDELVEWTLLFLLRQGERVDTLEKMGEAEIKACQPFVYPSLYNNPDDRAECP